MPSGSRRGKLNSFPPTSHRLSALRTIRLMPARPACRHNTLQAAIFSHLQGRAVAYHTLFRRNYFARLLLRAGIIAEEFTLLTAIYTPRRFRLRADGKRRH